MSETTFEGWAILEIKGFRRHGGYVTETTIAGSGFLRIDVPAKETVLATHYYRPDSVHCLTPTTEEVARAVAASVQREEQVYTMPALGPAAGTPPGRDGFMDPDDAADDDPELDDETDDLPLEID